jgi:hypothetical protein
MIKFYSFVQDIDVVFSSTVDTDGLVGSGTRMAKYSITIYFPEEKIETIFICFIVFGEFVLDIKEGITILEHENYFFVKKFFRIT